MSSTGRLGLLLVLGAASLIVACRPEEGATGQGASDEDRWAARRREMVERLEERGIRDERVVKALLSVERHRFVPARYAEDSYDIEPLPIGEEQTISSPYIVGFMTQILGLEGTEKVLEIGTGSGYQAAVLALIVPDVYSIEIRPTLAESGRRRLAELGYGNVHVACGDGYKGWPDEAPFDAIIVTAAPEVIPQALVDQLREGGRLIVPVGPQSENQELILLKKDDAGRVTEERVLPVRFVPMIRGD